MRRTPHRRTPYHGDGRLSPVSCRAGRDSMQDLLPLAERVAGLLKARGETLAVAESSTGGLLSATLLAVPGASAYFLGGGVIYTRVARQSLLGIDDQAMTGLRASTEPYAQLLA